MRVYQAREVISKFIFFIRNLISISRGGPQGWPGVARFDRVARFIVYKWDKIIRSYLRKWTKILTTKNFIWVM